MKRRHFIALAVATLVFGAAQAREPILSATKLSFGDATTLFVADWRGARIHALTLPPPGEAAGKPFNLKDVQAPMPLRRDDATGAMQLVTIPKGAYLRISDFINEYDFPGFQYRPTDPFRQAHKYFYKIEGFPERIRE